MTTSLVELLNDNEYELMVEALCALREKKTAALREAGEHDATRMFTAHDFGVPQIDALLTRLDAKPPEDDVAAALANCTHKVFSFESASSNAASGSADALEKRLAEALRSTRDCLQGWMEIQDEGDAREYDNQAVQDANTALAAYDAKLVSLTTEGNEVGHEAGCEPGDVA